MTRCGGRYCANNPLSYVDPDGQWFFLFLGALAGGIAGAYDFENNSWKEMSWQTLGDIALGATVGGLMGGAADMLLAAGEIGTIRFGAFEPNMAGTGIDGFLGISQTPQGISASTELLAGGVGLLGLSQMLMETPHYKDLHNPVGDFDPSNIQYPSVATTPLGGNETLEALDPNFSHTQIFEPGGNNYGYSGAGEYFTGDSPSKYKKVIYQFKDIARYQRAKTNVLPHYQKGGKYYHQYFLPNTKCHNLTRDVINEYERLGR